MTAIAVTNMIVNCVQLVALTWIAAWQQRAALVARAYHENADPRS